MRKTYTSGPPLDSDLLRSFLAVAQAGSVSGGALRLLRTQSAVSVQMQKLEQIIGQSLFDRHGRGVSLTGHGEQLLPVARRVVTMLDQAAAELRGGAPGGEIRLGIPEEYSDTLLPPILAGFTQDRPGARILLRCGSSTDFPAALGRGELDLALHTPETVAATDIVVHHERAVWAGSAFSEVESRRPLPVALFDRDCWWRQRCLDLLRDAGIPHEIVCTSESVAGIRAAISAGIAVGVLPHSVLTDGVRQLPDAGLPHLGGTPLVLGRSPGAPPDLAASLTAAITGAVRSLVPAVTAD